MPVGLKPIAFLDLDGPILEVSVRHHRVYADAVRQLGGTPLERPEYWREKRRRTRDAEILSRSGIPGADAAYQSLKLAAIEEPAMLALDQLQPGTGPVLAHLAQHAFVVLVTLRRSPQNLARQLVDLGLDRCLARWLTAPADEHAGWATKRDLILRAGLQPGPGDFFVGDTETDIRAGKALGITTIAVTNGIREESLLREQAPDSILASLADLPQPARPPSP